MSNHLDYEINKELGECYLFMGDLDKAEEYYRKAIDGDGNFASPFLGLATIAVQRGKLDDAYVLYNKAGSIELSDKSMCGMGLVRMEQAAYAEAFDHFAKALDINADNIVALNCLVRMGYQLSRLDQVLPYLQKSLEVSNEKAAIRVTIAGCLISLGRQDEAREHLEAVLGMDPTNSGARELFDTMAA